METELGASVEGPKRTDSGISLEDLKPISNDGTSSRLWESIQLNDPVQITFKFGQRVHVKLLDYATFSQWDAMEELMADIENEGIMFEGLWDVGEKMKICGGDWNARVRPGWDVHVYSQDAHVLSEDESSEDDSDSEGYNDEDKQMWTDEVLDLQKEEWCLPRWRGRVEQEKSIREQIREPSWVVLVLGCASMFFFIAAVIVYTA